MDHDQMRAFRDELEKLAGVELVLHGYRSDPTLSAQQRWAMERAADEQYDRAAKQVKTPAPRRGDFEKSPGFFGRLMGARPTFDQVGFEARRVQHVKELRDAIAQSGDPSDKLLDAYEHMESLRGGPRDTTAGKLTNIMLSDAAHKLKLYTDESYGDTPTSRFLNDRQLNQVVDLYKERMSQYSRPDEVAAHQKFLARAQALKSDPTLKGYRLEYA
jgi:hypothetical protein